MTFRIAIIGAGSVGFTKKLVQDLLHVPEFAGVEFALTDINAHNLDMIAQIVRRVVEANGLPARVTATTDRREALAGARYVMNVVRIGGLEAFADDIRIPLKYGVDQCVGDTICAGGILYGQRGIPAMLDFCRDIREVAEEGALLLNYANPMAMMTWAALDAGVRTVGLCHGVQNGHRQIARALGVPMGEVDVVCSGINHQTWYTDIRHEGRKVGAEELLAAFERHPVFSRQEKVRIDVLRRFGFYSTESNGHLSEYLPWYRKRPDEIARWISTDEWIHGETGGYLRYTTENRNWFETDFPVFLEEAGKPLSAHERTDEHASHILEALETGRTYRGHFNVRNGGAIANLPADCIVESPGFVDRFGINMAEGITLPLACAATCNVSVSVQRMSVQAAVTGDLDLLKLAVLHDPLVGAILNPEEVWQMVDEMVVAQAEWLPQYAHAVPGARGALAQPQGQDPRVGGRRAPGGARRGGTACREGPARGRGPRARHQGHGVGRRPCRLLPLAQRQAIPLSAHCHSDNLVECSTTLLVALAEVGTRQHRLLNASQTIGFASATLVRQLSVLAGALGSLTGHRAVVATHPATGLLTAGRRRTHE
jgi:alpha-galactosidase